MAPWIRRVWWATWFSKDVGVLVPGICDHPTLPGKREFADEIHLETSAPVGGPEFSGQAGPTQSRGPRKREARRSEGKKGRNKGGRGRRGVV